MWTKVNSFFCTSLLELLLLELLWFAGVAETYLYFYTLSSSMFLSYWYFHNSVILIFTTDIFMIELYWYKQRLLKWYLTLLWTFSYLLRYVYNIYARKITKKNLSFRCYSILGKNIAYNLSWHIKVHKRPYLDIFTKHICKNISMTLIFG